MAKKAKKSKAKKSSGKRRIGAAGKSNNLVMKGVGGLAAGIGGPIVLGFVAKMAPASISPKVISLGSAAVLALGGYMVGKRAKSPLMEGASIGLMSAGGLMAVKQFMPNLIGAAPVMIPTLPNRGMVSGPRDVPRIGDVSGFPHPATVSGMSRKMAIYGGM
jgi:hypothetical protein